jgi:predicted Zn-dependent protease
MRIAVIPVGRMDPAELETAGARVSKILHAPIELREAAPLPRAVEDPARGQFSAGPLLAALHSSLPRLKPVKLLGGEPATSPAGPSAADAAIFVTDVDLYTPATDGVLGEIDRPRRAALVSVRRLREAFYRRKADPAKQRSRLVKEILRAIGRLRTPQECRDPACVLAPDVTISDLDRKDERYCSPCWKRISTGVSHL